MFDKQVLAMPGAKAVLSALLALSVAESLAVVAQALGLARALAQAWAGEKIAALVAPLCVFALAFAARQVMGALRAGRMARYAQARADQMRASLLEQVLDAGGAATSSYGTGPVVSSLVEGVDQVRRYVEIILPKTSDLMVMPLATIVALFWLDPISGGITLAVLPFTVLFMVLIGTDAKARAARQHEAYDALSDHFVDSLRGIGTLELFGRAHERGQSVWHTSERFRKATVATLRVATASSLVLDLLATFGLAAVAVLLGFRLMGGTVQLEPALACLILVPECFAPIRRFASDFHASLDGRTAMARLTQMHDTLARSAVDEESAGARGLGASMADEKSAGIRALGAKASVAMQTSADLGGNNLSDADPRDANLGALWGPGASLSLEGITMLHGAASGTDGADSEPGGRADGEPGGRANGEPGGRASAGEPGSTSGDPTPDGLTPSSAPGGVHDIDLVLRAGERVALVGGSGAGKSTLLDLLAGFSSPESGSFVVHASADAGANAEHANASTNVGPANLEPANTNVGAGRANIARVTTLRRDDWRSLVAYIPQTPHVFSASLADNLRLYQPDASPEQVAAAVRAAGLQPLVDELPQGLDTLVGEAGRGLSGGQAQRIAIARAVLADRPVLLLDEPTAHLDVETELDVKAAILPLMAGRTVIIATHRLHWTRDVDRVVVLKAGSIAQQGTSAQVRADQNGAYAQLARAMRGEGR